MAFRKIVMVFGTFDILHRGHLNFFKQARKHRNYLVAVVARDASVFKMKGRKPLYNERDRVKTLEKVKFIDEVILGGKSDPLKIIEKHKPEVILLGYDQKVKVRELKDTLQKRGLNIKVFRARAYLPRIYKSSKLARLRKI
jgi:FAD synthetase